MGIFLALCLFLLSLTQVILGLVKQASFVDFYAYYGAGQAFVNGVSPYQKEFLSPIGQVNFMYPPGTLPVFALLTVLPEYYSILFFTGASIVFFIAALWISFSLIPDSTSISLPRKIISIALLLQTFPVKLTLTLGQINMFPLLFVVLGLFFLKKNRTYLSSFLTAVAATLKVTPAGLVPLMLFNKKISWVVFFFSFVILLNSSNLHFFSLFLFEELPRLLTAAQPSLDIYNQSLNAGITRLFGNKEGNHLLAFGLFSLFYGIITAHENKNQQDLVEQLLLILPLIVLFPQNTWQHHLVVTYPFLIYFFARSWLIIPIWLVLAIHFNEGHFLIKQFPFFASYQTYVLISLMIFVLWKKKFIEKICIKLNNLMVIFTK